MGSLTPSRENRAFRTGRRLPSGSRVTRGLVSSMEWEGAGEARRGVSWWGGHTRGHTPSTRACGVGTGPDRPLSRKGLPLKENECPSVSPKQPPPPPTEHPAGSLRGGHSAQGGGGGRWITPTRRTANTISSRPGPSLPTLSSDFLGFKVSRVAGRGLRTPGPGWWGREGEGRPQRGPAGPKAVSWARRVCVGDRGQ